MRLLLPALLLLALGGCVRHLGAPAGEPAALPDSGPITEIRDRVYTPDDWPRALHASVYRPRAGGRYPAVLVVHGGGWARRSPADMADLSRWLAEHGLVAVNIEYRFAPAYTFPAQLQDLQMAMRWLHVHADEYGIDRARVGAWGYSSGAHLVALLATVAGDPDNPLNPPYGGPVTRPKAVVAGGTPSDLRKFKGGELVPQFLGGEREAIPAVYARASPVTAVTPNTPPVFLYHGSWDRTVPKDHAVDFYDALRANGVDTELYLLNGRGHVATFLFGGGAEEAGLRFLERHLSAPRAD
ncbi:alpha/beta hydrolase [Alcanivorax marinus]|uniref:Alpha/beta hydrolase n=1 Tax=Alloalcanivorax marinus TaxID=1177169 RepID=A0A9Q3YP50_9GAMM|nr:alpha/beta hydrolase [Alloalcanivorax marinus]MCC4310472.1 alpha/beta hydrolase [Alloalcanivorax marinus]